jgi:CheY-like chemotaxis protein
VLVVDNNVDCCDVSEFLLNFYGVEVRKAFLAQEALKIFVEWQPDILVSEIALPEVDGFALVQQARTIAVERGKALLIIAVTAYSSEKTRQLALSGGFDFWFTKPLDFNNFVAVLAYLVICQSVFPIVQSTMINLVKIAI